MLIDSDQDVVMRKEKKLSRISGVKYKHHPLKQQQLSQRDSMQSVVRGRHPGTPASSVSAGNINYNVIDNNTTSSQLAALSTSSLSKSLSSAIHQMMPTPAASLDDKEQQDYTRKSDSDKRVGPTVSDSIISGKMRAKPDSWVGGAHARNGSAQVTCGDSRVFYHKHRTSFSESEFKEKSTLQCSNTCNDTCEPLLTSVSPQPPSPSHPSISPVADVFHSPSGRPGDRVEDMADVKHSQNFRQTSSVTPSSVSIESQLQHEQTSQTSPSSVPQDIFSTSRNSSTCSDFVYRNNNNINKSLTTSNSLEKDISSPKLINRNMSPSSVKSFTSNSTSPALSDISHMEKVLASSPLSTSSLSPSSRTSLAPQDRTPQKTTAFSVMDILDPSKFTGSSGGGSKQKVWNPWRPLASSAVAFHQGLATGLDKSPGMFSDGQGESLVF